MIVLNLFRYASITIWIMSFCILINFLYKLYRLSNEFILIDQKLLIFFSYVIFFFFFFCDSFNNFLKDLRILNVICFAYRPIQV